MPGFTACRWGRSKAIRLWPSRNSTPSERPSSLANAEARPSRAAG